jgi:tRNA(fMet)-specific endonuclease VapC
MSRLAVDTNAAVDYIRPDRAAPPPLSQAETIFLPLPVIGELFAGAFTSTRRDENLRAVEDLTSKSTVLLPTIDSARIYGQLRASAGGVIQTSKLNDLWIAALCIQHGLPLLTNDRGFDHIDGLDVLHW